MKLYLRGITEDSHDEEDEEVRGGSKERERDDDEHFVWKWMKRQKGRKREKEGSCRESIFRYTAECGHVRFQIRACLIIIIYINMMPREWMIYTHI